MGWDGMGRAIFEGTHLLSTFFSMKFRSENKGLSRANFATNVNPSFCLLHDIYTEDQQPFEWKDYPTLILYNI